MKLFCLCAASALVGAPLLISQESKYVDSTVEGHILRPEKLSPDVSKLKAPEGFRVSIFAQGLGKPRMLAVASDGAVYVTRRDPGDCLLVSDSGAQNVIAAKKDMHGIAIHGNTMYFATIKEIFRAERKPDGTVGPLQMIASDLPDAGQHPNRTLAIGPDGMLYVTVGSTCNACNDGPENATMLRMKPDGSGREVFARGLRNTIGFAWHPQTKALYGMDHGMDWLGNDAQNEELNLIEHGKHYGWPFVYGQGHVYLRVEPKPGTDPEQLAKTSAKPALEYTPHSAPMQMVFYTANQFGPESQGDAFVAMRGSWNRKPPSGYEVVRIHFENGKPTKIDPFLTGFLTETAGKWGYFGRPVGVAVAKDGSLLVADDSNGVIYKVSPDPAAVRSRTR